MSDLIKRARRKFQYNQRMTVEESYNLLRMTIMYLSCMARDLDKNTRQRFARRYFPMSDKLLASVYDYAKRDFSRTPVLPNKGLHTESDRKTFQVSYLKEGKPFLSENIEDYFAEWAVEQYHLKHQLPEMDITTEGRFFGIGELSVRMWEQKAPRDR